MNDLGLTTRELQHKIEFEPSSSLAATYTGMLQDGSNHYSKMYNYIVGEHSVLYIAFIPKQETGVTSSYILKDMKLLFVIHKCIIPV